jgi:hypothetical protein
LLTRVLEGDTAQLGAAVTPQTAASTT